MIALDASVVIAHFQPLDPHHDAATSLLRTHPDEDLLMHSLNLAEVLVGAVRAGRADDLLSDLRAIGVRAADPTDGEPLRLAVLRVETGLKLPGCCVLETASAHDAALATFDERLAQAARMRGIAVVPG